MGTEGCSNPAKAAKTKIVCDLVSVKELANQKPLFVWILLLLESNLQSFIICLLALPTNIPTSRHWLIR